MNKSLVILSASFICPVLSYAQSAIDAYRLSQPDLKGTARFMSMGGAFGALGGDLSSLSQNPAGIGVYRSNELGFSVNLDFQSATTNSQGNEVGVNQTKFLLNNIGGVMTMRLPSATIPNINFGFTYNKGASFNRQYAGQILNLRNSMSNYIAGITEGYGLQPGDFNQENPYADGSLPWLSTLGYQGWLIDASGEGENTRWYGQWGEGTSGAGSYNVTEKGSVDEYNIAIGGNISNVVYWGMNFDITNLNYTMNARWGESLSDAYVPSPDGVNRQSSVWDLSNYYNVNGTGFNYQIGVIIKPIQELRIGLAFHTPTWYNLNESFGASVDYQYGDEKPDGVDTNDGYLGSNSYDFRTPMKFIGSLAGVIGNNFILSMDYEYVPYNKMKFSQPGSYGINSGWDYDDGWGWDDWYPYAAGTKGTPTRAFGYNDDPFSGSNSDIEYYYQASHTIRLGAEYRLTPSFSVRAGYSYSTSPVKQAARDDRDAIYTSGTLPNYRFDNHTNYITCGFGYRYKQFYVDMAYVYKNINSTYHAYSPDVDYDAGTSYASPQSKLSLNNSQVILSAGFRF
ncbi:MAG: hypothetical protein K2M27_04490 [Muribaculaceae bacterium]|nr:hypothetical protein [Muribaculaceae bacterium]